MFRLIVLYRKSHIDVAVTGVVFESLKANGQIHTREFTSEDSCILVWLMNIGLDLHCGNENSSSAFHHRRRSCEIEKQM